MPNLSAIRDLIARADRDQLSESRSTHIPEVASAAPLVQRQVARHAAADHFWEHR